MKHFWCERLQAQPTPTSPPQAKSPGKPARLTKHERMDRNQIYFKGTRWFCGSNVQAMDAIARANSSVGLVTLRTDQESLGFRVKLDNRGLCITAKLELETAERATHLDASHSLNCISSSSAIKPSRSRRSKLGMLFVSASSPASLSVSITYTTTCGVSVECPLSSPLLLGLLLL